MFIDDSGVIEHLGRNLIFEVGGRDALPQVELLDVGIVVFASLMSSVELGTLSVAGATVVWPCPSSVTVVAPWSGFV